MSAFRFIGFLSDFKKRRHCRLFVLRLSDVDVHLIGVFLDEVADDVHVGTAGLGFELL